LHATSGSLIMSLLYPTSPLCLFSLILVFVRMEWYRLTMADHVASVCRSAYYHLRQIRPTVQSLTPDGSKTLVQAFISGRLDYCNSLLYGMTNSLFQHLQSVQNAAARLITRTGRREHITPVLRELQWLPIRCRVDFKRPRSCTRRCMARYHGTCRAIVSSSPM